MMKSKSFKFWTTQQLHEQFGLQKQPQSARLMQWLTATQPLSVAQTECLEMLRLDLLENADYWNEEELKIKFIGQIVELANLQGPGFRTFYDRPVSVVRDTIRLFGKLDMLVATGFQTPTHPFFCIHEYKQENNRDGDRNVAPPKGQLLAEMLAVQTLNATPDNPIYGCYVLGRNWFLVVLEGTQYAISDAFVGSQADIHQIFRSLLHLKDYINQVLNPIA